MISKFSQIRGLQPQFCKSFSRSLLEQFFLTVCQNNFANKILVILILFLFFCILVNRCELEEISLEENQTGFAALTSLQIQDNKLKNWQSIFCLNFFPILQGQAHHMFSRIFFTKFSLFCFCTR